jgi:hypothetical protein
VESSSSLVFVAFEGASTGGQLVLSFDHVKVVVALTSVLLLVQVMEQMTESHFQFEEDRAAREAKEEQVRPPYMAFDRSESF